MENELKTRRLSKTDRRQQLIEVALNIVRGQGTDALTLGYLAKCAGVSKPVAYDHFTSRSQLLIALFGEIDRGKVNLLLEALRRAPQEFRHLAKILCDCYLDCHDVNGTETHALTAALKGDDEMESFQRQLLDGYIDIYCAALRDFVSYSDAELRLKCTAIIGAAEAISQDVVRGRATRDQASRHLTAMIISWIDPAGAIAA
jgi:AcrR family transcriptional regulator